MSNQETCPCGLCGKQTPMLGTKRCDSCWELERRVQHAPTLALRVLAHMGYPVHPAMTVLQSQERRS